MAYINGTQILFSGNTSIVEASSEVKQLRVDVDSNSRKIDALFKLNEGITHQFETDSDAAYKKTVLSGAKLASINRIGGASTNSANLWNLASAVSGTGAEYFDCSFPAGTYTLSLLATSSDTDATTSAVIINPESGSNKTTLHFSRGTRNSQTFTINSPIVQIAFWASSDSKGASGDTFAFADIMLNEGSTALPYEPFGLVNAKVTEIKSESANLLNMSKCVTTAGTTIVVGEGTLTVTGYIGINSITNLVCGKTYTFKATSTRTSETEGGGISIECYDSNSAIVYSTYRQHTLNPNVTFTVPLGTVRTRFYFYGGMQNATTSATYTDVMLNEGSTALPYSPYGTIGSLPIPSAVQDLPDYGKTDTYIEWRDGGRFFVKTDEDGKKTTTDISDILPDANTITVEGGGTLTFLNDYEMEVPNEVEYAVKLSEV